jgi:hypothetical protein
LDVTLEIFKQFTTQERYPIKKLFVLHAYLSDLSIDYPLRFYDVLFVNKERSTINGRIHTQLRVLERILNFPDNIPAVVQEDQLVLLNAYRLI